LGRTSRRMRATWFPTSEKYVKNYDKEPGFWLTVAILLPLIVATEIVCLVDDLLKKIQYRD
jgi:hypothetical protein